jgi:hypothetical protein
VLALRAGAEYQVESRGAGRAAWWPAPGAASGSGERRLFGEIHLDRALAPPMDTPDVALTVCPSVPRERLLTPRTVLARAPPIRRSGLRAGRRAAA